MLSCALLLCLVVPGGCGGPSGTAFGRTGDDEKAAEEDPPAPVVVDVMRTGAIEAELRAASTIEAERQVMVHAESTGRILELLVEEGDVVKAGQLMARVKYEAQAAGLTRASTSLDKAETDLAIARDLFARKVASKTELDAAELAFRTAQLDVSDRRRDVKNTKVLAPISGKVTERFVASGAFVTSGAQLITITDFGSLVARVFVPEKELDRIRIDQPAAVAGKAATSRKGAGKVARIAPVVDPTTGTVKVTVALPEPTPDSGPGFVPGMYAEVTLTTERHEHATLVAKEAILWEDEAAWLFLVEGDVVHRVPVKIGLQDLEHAEILEGPAVGTEIVIVGHAGLKDGAKIERVDRHGNTIEGAEAGAGEDLAQAAKPEGT